MKIAITGGNGFVGRALVRHLLAHNHDVTVLTRSEVPQETPGNEAVNSNVGKVTWIKADVTSLDSLKAAFDRCEAVAHCAGINRETAKQTFHSVHVQGTANVLEACHLTGVKRIAFTSFLKARAGTRSPYHESKWQAEELIRTSNIDYTILKPGVIFGKGDHMISHMHVALRISPVFGLVGADLKLRPIALSDFTRVLAASLADSRMLNKTYAVLGGEEVPLSEAGRRLATVIKRPILPVAIPVSLLNLAAAVMEKTMPNPLLSVSQITMIAEGLADKLPADEALPLDLQPTSPFSLDLIRQALA